ncbi:uncharacterized protein OCT59_013593 [Rhizophagus irregularis]|uniref:MIR domain-containing protein n=2 Tax=Rhizophagus irregularis TaxID=588596 RepID=A0A015L8S1_RHIIW|nr:hypothetical protein RirG_036330 [Rhizophagus irregularis DAOM 197198w]UZO21193.1 hypothetical protein OCT59_013593 [Rhizophagus irregularis]GBC45721.1 hypothetical protein GLOIN_2v1544279 [Rhizophagus irregularis DAOM 181602=DAOM 197198]
MDFPKYNGTIHPDEWINDIRIYFKLKNINDRDCLKIVLSFIDPIITLPNRIDSFEKLRNAFKEDISFTVFKRTNKKLLESLRYIPERKGGNTSKFVSNFRKLCYNSEVNDIEEQKIYFRNALPKLSNDNYNNCYDYFLEFTKRWEKIKSMNHLVKEIEEIVTVESNLIKNESIVALKHVSTGKYLSSIENLCYTTGSKSQMAFVSSQVESDLNALWKIEFSGELAMYNKTPIRLRHIKSGKYLGLYYYYLFYPKYYTCYRSPITDHREVCCAGNKIKLSWEFKHSKLENRQGYLKSNDIINLRICRRDTSLNLFLRSHDIQFTIGNDNFQEVVCHNNERLGGNDEWCIELIKKIK